MRPTHRSRTTRPALAIAAAAALVPPLGFAAVSAATAAPGVPADATLTAGPTDTYIVQVAGNPLATNPTTKPAPGDKVDVDSSTAKAYRRQLTARHQQLLKAVQASTTVRDYGVSFNGFAAKLTKHQADALAKRDDVVRVWKNETRYATTNRTPEFLGMSGANGVWQQKFGGPANAGAGMIIGDIDSGIWPENPSFAPLKDPKDQAIIDAKWNGICDGGTGPDKVVCNNKIIGARAYYGASTVPDFEYKNPRGYNAHGTHTAATAAGNFGVQAKNGSMDLGTVSGMAPAARIAVYKALWATPDGRASGATSDIVAAIDQAVADGVDVINFSISGSTDSVVSPDDVAFFYAAQAGVFVAAAAGNDGDSIGAGSVNHNAPWQMTVAASTSDRPVGKTVTTGDGMTMPGVGLGPGIGKTPLVSGAAIALPGVDPQKAKECWSDVDDKTPGLQPALDPAKAKGKIVYCVRGGNGRVDKSFAVMKAGGVGMIHGNTTDKQSLNADLHFVPSIHLPAMHAKMIEAYITSAGDKATASISETDTKPARAPQMAGFSSFGPAIAGKGDLLKPDITAPGVDILAAVSPKGDENGKNFDLMSGTSMATPHIAGIGALIKAKHPTWSPMAIKSAMMTTASQLDNQGLPIQRGTDNATPIDMGAGHIAPAAAFEPGLVYDSTPKDWARYACALGQAQQISDEGFCESLGAPMDPSDLNYPSIAIGDLAGTQTVTRTLTNVTGKPITVDARVQQPTGVGVKVSPAKLTIPAGKSRSYKVTFTRSVAQFNDYVFGAITWQGANGLKVRSPLAIRPVALAVPDEVKGAGTDGSKTITIKAGLSGVFSADVNGLVPDTVNATSTKLGDNAETTVDVPAGLKVLRFATYDSDYTKGTDVDITVTKDGQEVGKSAGSTAEESVTLRNPAAGKYTVSVNAFAGPNPLLVKLHTYQVTPGAKGNLTVTPSKGDATVGQEYPVTLAWKGLDPAHRWLGVVDAKNNDTDTIGSFTVDIKP